MLSLTMTTESGNMLYLFVCLLTYFILFYFILFIYLLISTSAVVLWIDLWPNRETDKHNYGVPLEK